MSAALAPIALLGLLALLSSACAVRSSPSTTGGHAAAVRLTGEIVDSWCWSVDGKAGPDHATCAKNCLANGNPPVFVADDGTAWLLVPAYDHIPVLTAAKARAGERVTVAGDPIERGGMKVLAIRAVDSAPPTPAP